MNTPLKGWKQEEQGLYVEVIYMHGSAKSFTVETLPVTNVDSDVELILNVISYLAKTKSFCEEENVNALLEKYPVDISIIEELVAVLVVPDSVFETGLAKAIGYRIRRVCQNGVVEYALFAGPRNTLCRYAKLSDCGNWLEPWA